MSTAVKHMLIANVGYPITVLVLLQSFSMGMWFQLVLGIFFWLTLLGVNIYHAKRFAPHRTINIVLLVLNALSLPLIGATSFVTALYLGVPLLIAHLT